MAQALRPRQQVRRFDVFAEYSKLKALKEGRPLDEAKGHGIWLAKVVASRRYGAPSSRQTGVRRAPDAEREEPEAPEPFRTLGGELQTDALFDREIIGRMGAEFYREVFAPTLAKHFQRGDRYESIRDNVRRDWKPAQSSEPPGH
jgi:hypothetical protein